MALEAGTKLGHYEVVSSLGAGGMGEVYRAKDTKLGREVAIKLLLEEVSQDAERLARFEREACSSCWQDLPCSEHSASRISLFDSQGVYQIGDV